LQAKDVFTSGQKLVADRDAQAISQFEKSRDLFTQLGDACEAAIAENWAVQLLRDVGKVAESRPRWATVIANAKSKKFIILLPPAYYWLGMAEYSQCRFSKAARNLKTHVRFA
jgi:hypothetical protein